MKKWTLPILVFGLEIMFFAPIFYGSINGLLPNAIADFYHELYKGLEAILRFLHFPIIIADKNYFAPSLLLFLFIVNIIFLGIHLIFHALRKRKTSNDRDAEALVKRRDINPFDPVFFVNRFPLFRLIFLFIPTVFCIFICLFFLIDNFRTTINGVEILQRICQPLTDLYSKYDVALGNLFIDYLWYKIAIFMIIVVTIFGTYWFATSFLAIIFRLPMARHRAKKARKKFEEREKMLRQKVLILENAEILQHAHFKKEKAAVETIAKIDSRIKIAPPLYTTDVVSETPNVIDLGVLIKDNSGENNITQPMLYKKNIRTIQKNDGTSVIPNFSQIENANLEPVAIQPTLAKQELEPIENKEEEILSEEKATVKPIVRPKLREKFKKAPKERIETTIANPDELLLKPYYHNMNETKNLSPNEAFEKRVVAVKPLVRPISSKVKKSNIEDDLPVQEKETSVAEEKENNDIIIIPPIIEAEVSDKEVVPQKRNKKIKKKVGKKNDLE